MRYEHERHSVGPLPASDMRARICYRGAGLPNTACLPGRERGLTGGRRAAKSPPTHPLLPLTPSTTTHRHHYHNCPAKGTLEKQQSPLTSFHTDLTKLVAGRKGCLFVPVLAEESIMVMSASASAGTVRGETEWTNVLYDMRSMTGLRCHVHHRSSRYQDLPLTHLCSKTHFSETSLLWKATTHTHTLTHIHRLVIVALILSSLWLVQL